MRKNILLIAALVGSLFFASCGGGNKDANIMKQADEMYANAEKTVNGIDNFDDFYAFLEEFEGQKNDFLTQVMAPAYAVNDSMADVPSEVSEHIYQRATEYNHVEAEKYAELLEPYVVNLENAIEAVNQAKSRAERDAMIEKTMEAYEAIMPYSDYDNVPPELQERSSVIVEKLDAIL